MTAARPCTPTRHTIPGCSSDQHARHRTGVNTFTTRGIADQADRASSEQMSYRGFLTLAKCEWVKKGQPLCLIAHVWVW
jgi:hypothetical protein